MDLVNLQHELDVLKDAGIDEFHFDVADGNFAQGFALGTDLIKAIKNATTLPCTAHLMLQDPQRHIQPFIDAHCDTIYLHIETPKNLHSTLTQIRENGLAPGIAINPTTPLTKVDYILPLVDRLLLTSTAQNDSILPTALERTRILYENITYNEYRIEIEIEGNFDIETATKFAHAGAQIFILRKMHLANKQESNIERNITHFKTQIQRKNNNLQQTP